MKKNNLFKQKFSGKLCEMNCRAQNAIELCNCKPFFYPFIGKCCCSLSSIAYMHKTNAELEMPVDGNLDNQKLLSISDAPECKIDGYLCLHQNTWPIWTLRSCKCPASCIHHSYIEQSKSLRQWSIYEGIPFKSYLFAYFPMNLQRSCCFDCIIKMIIIF